MPHRELHMQVISSASKNVLLVQSSYINPVPFRVVISRSLYCTHDAQVGVRVHRKMGELQELEECYRRLEQQQLEWPAETFSGYAKELESKIKLAEARKDFRNDHCCSLLRENLLQSGMSQRTSEARSHWIVERSEVHLTDEFLEKGGWGEVREAEFRGTIVCAKYPNLAIWSEDNYELFMEEMELASKVHHPNIVLFMGACVGIEVIVLTENLPTSLRKQFQWKGNHLSQEQRISISLDIARALNYLHLMQPDPIIHRDVNSANVLLEALPPLGWRAKLADHCSVNFKQQYRPTNSEMHISPETVSCCSLSPKMDIFSFGILLIEIYTSNIPEASSYQRLIACIQDQSWVALIQDCISKKKESRPSAAEIIVILKHRNVLMNNVSNTSYGQEASFFACYKFLRFPLLHHRYKQL